MRRASIFKIGEMDLNRQIIDLMDDKIRQLERYNEVTEQMMHEDMDTFGDLLDERQKIITAMDGISVDIKHYVSEQSIERQDKLNAMLHFEDIGELTEDLLELQDKIMRVKQLREEIMENDAKAFSRVKQERDSLREKLENAGKSKKISGAFSQTAVDVTKGSRLNVSN